MITQPNNGLGKTLYFYRPRVRNGERCYFLLMPNRRKKKSSCDRNNFCFFFSQYYLILTGGTRIGKKDIYQCINTRSVQNDQLLFISPTIFVRSSNYVVYIGIYIFRKRQRNKFLIILCEYVLATFNIFL